MKKIVTLIFFLISLLSFGIEKNLLSIKTLKLSVNEKTFSNNKTIEKSYDLVYSLPNTLKKVIKEPKTHKGEIFIYKDNIKLIYLPIFDQVTKEENVQEENFLVETIKFFQENYKNNKSFKEIYDNKKNFRIKKENLEFEILKMTETDGYRLPNHFKIYEGKNLLAELKVFDIKVNEKILESEFEIK